MSPARSQAADVDAFVERVPHHADPIAQHGATRERARRIHRDDAHRLRALPVAGDELIDAQLSQVGWDYDRRTIFSASTPYSITDCGATQVPGLYTPLAVARFDADKILKLLQGWTDAQVTNRQSLMATAAVYAGYSLELLGEAMCSGAISESTDTGTYEKRARGGTPTRARAAASPVG